MSRVAAVFLLALGLLLLFGPELAPFGYEMQDRGHILSGPDGRHWLGTDAVGRDNFARLLYGGRLSLLLASVSALLACGIAAVFGTIGALAGGAARFASATVFDVMMSLPWYLLVFLIRAILPLETPPMAIAAATFLILGLVGWAHGARTIRDAVEEMAGSAWIRQARATGCQPFQLLRGHIAPNLRPLLVTQFLLLLPVQLLSEATLGMLGLGIPEPLPSWGGSLEELVRVGQVGQRPWALAPALLLALTSISLRLVAEGESPAVQRLDSKRLIG